MHRVSMSSASVSLPHKMGLFRCHTRRVKKLAVRKFLVDSLFESSEDVDCVHFFSHNILFYAKQAVKYFLFWFLFMGIIGIKCLLSRTGVSDVIINIYSSLGR